MGEQIFSAANGGPTPEQMNTAEGLAACGEPMPEKRKRLRKKEQQRKNPLY